MKQTKQSKNQEIIVKTSKKMEVYPFSKESVCVKHVLIFLLYFTIIYISV